MSTAGRSDQGAKAGTHRPRLLGPRGDAAIDALLQQRPLLAFDFDGTLAPIVARPADARPLPALVERLALLAQRLPVAVISGRSLADLRPRLGFAPTYAVGSHGADDAHDPAGTAARVLALDTLRAQLRAQSAELQAAGVLVEDKGASIALHHRLAPSRARAEAAIAALLAHGGEGLSVFGGKRVVNVVAAGSPDKAAALLALVTRAGAGAALFAGDDVNDEPVFEAAPPHWLTLRVGRPTERTAAQWRVDGPSGLASLLQRLIERSAAPVGNR